MAPPVPALLAGPPAGPLLGPGLSGGSFWHCRPGGVAKTAAPRLPRSGEGHLDWKFPSLQALLCSKFWQKTFLARTSSKNGNFSGFLAGAWARLNTKRIVGARRAGSLGPSGPGPTGCPSCRAPARPGALRGVVLALSPRRCRQNGGATPAVVRGGAFGLEIPVTSHTFMCQILAEIIFSKDFEQKWKIFRIFSRPGPPFNSKT